MSIIKNEPGTRHKALIHCWNRLRKHAIANGDVDVKAIFEGEPDLSEDTLRDWMKGSISKSTTGTLSTTTAVKMNDHCVHNFQEFRGTPWLLSSGKDVDEALCQYTVTLKKESALHSFVIDKLNIVLSLFDKDDQEVIRSLIDNGDKKLLETCTVPEWQKLEIRRYQLPPKRLSEVLACGWKSEDNDVEKVPFRRMIYDAILGVHSFYMNQGYKLPKQQSEAWYRMKLWAREDVGIPARRNNMSRNNATHEPSSGLGDRAPTRTACRWYDHKLHHANGDVRY
ncbi:MAG: hypothetical protein J3Q66DRAFT_391182 [Benniella sp.]|nr:MAG: hypothetical protein J3Q66DRAFT_391182 [Benniella sp.]